MKQNVCLKCQLRLCVKINYNWIQIDKIENWEYQNISQIKISVSEAESGGNYICIGIAKNIDLQYIYALVLAKPISVQPYSWELQ